MVALAYDVDCHAGYYSGNARARLGGAGRGVRDVYADDPGLVFVNDAKAGGVDELVVSAELEVEL